MECFPIRDRKYVILDAEKKKTINTVKEIWNYLGENNVNLVNTDAFINFVATSSANPKTKRHVVYKVRTSSELRKFKRSIHRAFKKLSPRGSRMPSDYKKWVDKMLLELKREHGDATAVNVKKVDNEPKSSPPQEESNPPESRLIK